MKISCLVITTTIKERFHLLCNAIDSIERCNDESVLDQKVLSIDIVEGQPYRRRDFEKFEKMGWHLAKGPCSGSHGMANNMHRGLAYIDGDILFYCEDDVIIQKIPTRKNLDLMFYNTRPFGAIVYNTHADNTLEKEGTESRLNYINDTSKYFGDGDDTFLLKGEPIKDEYWICFPAAIMKTDHFRSCLSYACKNCLEMGMEPGMTKAWFDLGFGSEPVAMYVQRDILNDFPVDFQKLHDRANMQFWNNDVNLRHESVNERQNTIF